MMRTNRAVSFVLCTFLFLTLLPAVSGFVIHHHGLRPSVIARQMSDAPSDTGSDDFEYQDVVTVESSSGDSNAAPGEALVSNVLNLMPSSLGSVSDETRTAINEALYKLEALNPTPQPTLSPLLNGVWELRYVGGYSSEFAMPSPTRELALFLYSGGYSPGIFALTLAQRLPAALVDVTGGLEISISRQQPRIEASVQVKALNNMIDSRVVVKARLEIESDVRMREIYESASVLDQSVNLPSPLAYARDLYATYVDNDLLIVRDASGVPEVLTRKEKTFSRNWGTDPSALEDMVPPGEESI